MQSNISRAIGYLIAFILLGFMAYASLLSIMVISKGDSVILDYANWLWIVTAIVVSGIITLGLVRLANAAVTLTVLLGAAVIWMVTSNYDLMTWGTAHLMPGANYSQPGEPMIETAARLMPHIAYMILSGITFAYGYTSRRYWLWALGLVAVVLNMVFGSVVISVLVALATYALTKNRAHSLSQEAHFIAGKRFYVFGMIVGAVTLALLAPINFFAAGYVYAVMSHFGAMGLVVASFLMFYVLGGFIIGGLLGRVMAKGIEENQVGHAWAINVIVLLFVLPNIFWVWDVQNYHVGSLMTPMFLPGVILFPAIVHLICKLKYRKSYQVKA
jgi:hypothetical protein